MVEADAAAYQLPPGAFDVALCLGACFIWGHIGGAARALRPAVRPGGQPAVGEPYWRRGAEPAEAATSASADLTGTVGRLEAAGATLTGVIASSDDDWDGYESLHWRAIEEWIQENPAAPEVAELRRQNLQRRAEYLEERRERLGWAIFTARL